MIVESLVIRTSLVDLLADFASWKSLKIILHLRKQKKRNQRYIR